jgi:hypothetical protein
MIEALLRLLNPRMRALLSGLSRRPYLIPVVLLPLLYALPFFAGDVLLFRDLMHFTIPQQIFNAAELAKGRLPEWTPLIFGGVPHLAEPGVGVFYPPNLVYHLLAPERAETLFVLMHLPIAGIGAYWLARDREFSPAAAAATASIYVSSGYLLSMHGSHYYLASAALLPLAVATLTGAAATRRPRAIAVAALVVTAMLLNGEPQAIGFALVLSVALSPLARPALMALAGAVGLGIAGGAAQLLPSAYFFTTTTRTHGVSLADSSTWFLHPLRWIEFIAPMPFGLAFPDNGQWSGRLLDGIHHVPWAPGLYLGPLVLLCAAVAVLGRRDRISLTLGGIGLLALGVAAGQHLPLYKLAYHFVPGVKLFRYPEKYALVPTFVLAILAGRGLGFITESRQLRLGLRWASLGLAVLFGGLAGAAWAGRERLIPLIADGLARSDANLSVAYTLGELVVSLAHVALIALVVALLLRLSERRPRLLLPAALCILVVDGFGVGSRLLSYGPGSFLARPPELVAEIRVATPPGSTGRFYREDATCRYSGSESGDTLIERVRAHHWATGKPNILTRFGVADTLGYTAAERSDKLRAWDAAMHAGLTSAARLFGAAVHVTCQEGVALARPFPGPLPRAFVTPTSRALSAAAIYDALGTPGLDLRTTALLEGKESVPGSGGSATVSDPSYTEVHVKTAGGGGTLVLLDTYDRGWRATLDGIDAPIQRAFALFRAVAVPPGDHEVVFHYSAPGLRTGICVSTVGLLLVLWLVFYNRWPRWRRPAQGALRDEGSQKRHLP